MPAEDPLLRFAMKNPEWQRIREVFEAACEIPRTERAAYLDQACGPDQGLRARVDQLLAAAGDDDFLEPPNLGPVRGNRGEHVFVPASADEFLGGRVFGGCRLHRELGRGGMGIVYEAEQLRPHRPVAVKVLSSTLFLSEESVARFRQEAEAGARRQHPGIVTVYEYGEDQGIHYIVQELVPGGRTLADSLAELRPQAELPESYYRRSTEVVVQVAEALQAAHEAGVVHRDVKPGNILVTESGAPKVTDFGLAKIEDALARSRTGAFAGTPFYMSPEQAAAPKTAVDGRSDVFSLGATLYETLTLTRAFEGDSSQEVLRRILLDDPLAPHRLRRRVPRDLSVICMKALEKHPARRYQSMAEMVADLRRFLGNQPIVARPPGLLRRSAKWMQRHPTITGLSVLGTASMAVILYMLAVTLAAKGEAFHHANQARFRATQAEERAQELAEERAKVLRLSDLARLRELVDEAEVLWPAQPQRVPDYERWLKAADDLLARASSHRETLAELAAEVELTEGHEGEEIRGQRWWYQELLRLTRQLREFAAARQGLRAEVERRLGSARTLAGRSLVAYESEWQEAVDEIFLHEIYDLLELAPQLGLVPLGPDPDSGLWEFWHVESGSCPQRHPETQRLLLNESTGLVFVLLPAARFWMGAQGRDPQGPNYDSHVFPLMEPVHEVELEPFFISKFEMTQGQWRKVTGKNPSRDSPETSTHISLLHPVEGVSWEDCGLLLFQLGLALPSEAQWEYAARGGTSTRWWLGQELESIEVKVNLADQALKRASPLTDWQRWDDQFAYHAPVGTFPANPFGLHEVIGTVFERCRDEYAVYTADGEHPLLPAFHPRQQASLADRAIRGASYTQTAGSGRSAARAFQPPAGVSADVGLRPVRLID
jgi:formylglycine-generating enzyme required for sulfatase activity